MRKTEIEGDFIQRFIRVLTTTIEAANRISKNKINKDVHFNNNLFRFIANDRLYAENTAHNQELYKQEIQKALNNIYTDNNLEFKDVSTENERLAFTVRLDKEINIFEEK